jgi:hypothetical protein
MDYHTQEDNLDITEKFNGTLNIYEQFKRNDDGDIVYYATRWGGLVGTVTKQNMPVDWSGYESVTFQFAQPTTVGTQIMISERLKTAGKPGITSLTCYFDGQDVSSVEEVLLQASDTTTIHLRRVFLTPNDGTWESIPVWQGNCAFGNWENGFVIPAEKFVTADEGDKVEFIFTTDRSNPDVSYWLFKTIYNQTDSTLQGNDNELNKWGCAMVGKESTVYRIVLTAHDAERIREKGIFVNGYYNTVTQCNLLRKTYTDPD